MWVATSRVSVRQLTHHTMVASSDMVPRRPLPAHLQTVLAMRNQKVTLCWNATDTEHRKSLRRMMTVRRSEVNSTHTDRWVAGGLWRPGLGPPRVLDSHLKSSLMRLKEMAMSVRERHHQPWVSVESSHHSLKDWPVDLVELKSRDRQLRRRGVGLAWMLQAGHYGAYPLSR